MLVYITRSYMLPESGTDSDSASFVGDFKEELEAKEVSVTKRDVKDRERCSDDQGIAIVLSWSH